MVKKLGGWQIWVEFYEGYVIKTPKTKKEIRDHIRPFLKITGRLKEINWRTDSMIKNVKNSIRLVKKTKAPFAFFGNPEFLENGKIKQERAIQLGDELKKHVENGDLKSAKKLIDEFIKLTLELWKYGLHEKTFKFYSNFGIIQNKVVMTDFLELTGNKRTVVNQIKRRYCDRPYGLTKKIPVSMQDYYVKKSRKYFTLENLNSLWKKKGSVEKV